MCKTHTYVLVSDRILSFSGPVSSSAKWELQNWLLDMDVVRLISFIFVKICELLRLENLKNKFIQRLCLWYTSVDEMLKNKLTWRWSLLYPSLFLEYLIWQGFRQFVSHGPKTTTKQLFLMIVPVFLNTLIAGEFFWVIQRNGKYFSVCMSCHVKLR